MRASNWNTRSVSLKRSIAGLTQTSVKYPKEGIGFAKLLSFANVFRKGLLRVNAVPQESLAKAMRVSKRRVQGPRSTADYGTAAKITQDSHAPRTVA